MYSFGNYSEQERRHRFQWRWNMLSRYIPPLGPSFQDIHKKFQLNSDYDPVHSSVSDNDYI